MAIEPIFFQKNFRLRQAEAVDALLYISDGEKVFPFTGNGVKNAVLHLVGVLIFVHHDLHISVCDLLRQLRGTAVGGEKNIHGVVLLIREVRRVAAHLFLLKAADEVRRQV